MIAARMRGELKSAFTGPPELAKDQKRPDNFPAYNAETDGPANLVVVADCDILADRFWVRIADFFGQQTATPFSDNGPFVANLIDTLAGGDALIGLRARGDTSRPFILVNEMQGDAEAKFRQTEQTLQKHLDAVQKQLRTLRQGPGGGGTDQANAQAVITPEQRAAIDAARTDIVNTRQQLRAVQYHLNRDISRLRDRAACIQHRAGADIAGYCGDRARRRAPPPSREGTRMIPFSSWPRVPQVLPSPCGRGLGGG